MASKDKGYGDVIKRCEGELSKLFKNSKKWNAENELILRIYDIYYQAIYQEIHENLDKAKNDDCEQKIRDIIRKNVIGYRDKKREVVYIGAIEPLKAKLMQVSGSKKLKEEYCARYAELYDNFMALASFRSFKHYCLYFEQCYAPEDKRIWVHADNHGIAEGMWYAFNRMALYGDIKNMFKQTPTGYFKTYSNICFIPSASIVVVSGSSMIFSSFSPTKARIIHAPYHFSPLALSPYQLLSYQEVPSCDIQRLLGSPISGE